jgi:hypothetical protein
MRLFFPPGIVELLAFSILLFRPAQIKLYETTPDMRLFFPPTIALGAGDSRLKSVILFDRHPQINDLLELVMLLFNPPHINACVESRISHKLPPQINPKLDIHSMVF